MSDVKPKRARKPKPSETHVKPANVLELIEARLSPIQRQVLHDASRFIVARCSRRAGKTFLDAAKLVFTAEKFPGDTSVYFGLTKDAAKEAIWDELLKVLDESQIPYTYSEHKLEINLVNGSRILLIGADLSNVKDRLRGRKFRLVIVDECAFYYSIDKLIFAVLLPTLADLKGQILMTSSPGELPKGLFYEADIGERKKQWKQYHWTGFDNPYFQRPAEDPKFANAWEEELNLVVNMQYGGDWDNPTFCREWLGTWKFDRRTLVYPFDLKHRLVQEQKVRDSEYVAALNLGVPGKQAAVIGKISDYSRELQVVKAYSFKSRNLDDLASTVEQMIEDYDLKRVICHIGDHPRDILDDFKSRYKLPVAIARHEKSEYYQRLIATDLESGHIRPVEGECDPLLDEWLKIVKGANEEELPDQETLLADAFFVMYLDAYVTHLKQAEPEESVEDQMERELIEGAMAELEERRSAYGEDF